VPSGGQVQVVIASVMPAPQATMTFFPTLKASLIAGWRCQVNAMPTAVESTTIGAGTTARPMMIAVSVQLIEWVVDRIRTLALTSVPRAMVTVSTTRTAASFGVAVIANRTATGSEVAVMTAATTTTRPTSSRSR
jgi:hypothetical protein